MEFDLTCDESIDDSVESVEVGGDDTVLAALSRRERPVRYENMLLGIYYTRAFNEWAISMWDFVGEAALDSKVAYVAIRVFASFMSTRPAVPWDTLAWERVASLWIAIKLEDCRTTLSGSASAFLHSFHTSETQDDAQCLYAAERKVLRALNFAMSDPCPIDFADALFEVVKCEDAVHTRVLAVLCSASLLLCFATVSPYVLAAAAIVRADPDRAAEVTLHTSFTPDRLDDTITLLNNKKI